MQIGKTIRKYRKELGITQEEMAHRLGVTTPAVNKWENENSYPDISLLAPIARLLGISLDTLLSYQENLTEYEIKSLINTAVEKSKNCSYEEIFLWAKDILETYPNCLNLTWQLATLLDVWKLEKKLSHNNDYDNYILHCFSRVLSSDEDDLRTKAADSLFSYYVRQKDYQQAESYLPYFSSQNPERKLKQGVIYEKTNQREKAYKVYEELLFSFYQILSLTLHHLYLLTMEEKNYLLAEFFVKKQECLVSLFEMGNYHKAAAGLELSTVLQQEETVLDLMEEMLSSLNDLTGFSHSLLYQHLSFNETAPTFREQLRKELLQCFGDEATYGFLKGNSRYEKLIKV